MSDVIVPATERMGTVLGGVVLYPFERAKEMLEFYRELTATAPDELTAHAALLTSSDGVRLSAILACYAGPLGEGEAVLRPVREFGPPMTDLIGPMPHAAVERMFAPIAPSGLLNYWRSTVVGELATEVIDVIVAGYVSAPSLLSSAVVEHVGGYRITAASVWRDASQSDENIAWSRRLCEAIRAPAGDAAYANYLSEHKGVRAAHGASYERLVAVKHRWDPTNALRVNQNAQDREAP